MSLVDVLIEHKQLKTSFSSDDHYAWHLVEVVVETPFSNRNTEVSTTKQLSNVQTTLPVHLDLSKHSPQEGIDDFPLSSESDVDMNCQANMFHMCDMCGHMRQPSSDSHIIQSPCSIQVVCRVVRNLKRRAYDNSMVDYSPNNSSHTICQE